LENVLSRTNIPANVVDEFHEFCIVIAVPLGELLAVNDAVAALALEDPRGEVVRLHF
jgi:hypothetical protein